MPRASDSRQRMIRTAAMLFQRQGYSATGLKQIVEESGAPRGSLYFHFPGGKEALAAEALKQACENRLRVMREVFYRSDTAAEAIERLVIDLRDSLVESDFQEGCPIATVVLETAACSDSLQRVCSRAWREWSSLFERRLVREGHSPDRAAGLASVALSMVEGGLMLSRAHRSRVPLDAVLSEIGRVLARPLEGSSSKGEGHEPNAGEIER